MWGIAHILQVRWRWGEDWPAEIYHWGTRNQHLVNHWWGSSFADESSSCVTHGIGLIMLRELLLRKRRVPLRTRANTGRASSSLQVSLLARVVFSSFLCDMNEKGWTLNELGPESAWLYSGYQHLLLVFRSQFLTFSSSICHPSIFVILRAVPNILLGLEWI